MAKRVLLTTRDLFFRSKLQAVVRSAGGEVVREPPCDLAVIELRGAETERFETLVAQGVAVVAFGSHLKADELREARARGARAVPNSEVESTLRALLAEELSG